MRVLLAYAGLMAPAEPPSGDDAMMKRILETTRELEQLIAQSPKAEPDPNAKTFREFINLYDFPDEVQVGLLSEFLELALPDMSRRAQPLRATVLNNQEIPEQELETLNGWLGVVPARVRQFEWLEAPAIRLAADAPFLGLHATQADESGVLLGRSLHALTDGRLALLHLVGTWTNPNKMARRVTTIADAQLIEPWVALQHFPLHRMLGALRSCLWDKTLSEGKTPHAPDLEARRARFTSLIADLDAATRAHRERLRRVGDEAAGDGAASGG